MIFTVLEYPALYESLRRFAFRKDIPKDLRQHAPLRGDFGLWGIWYLVRSTNGLVCVDGSEMPFHIAHICDRSYLGRRDTQAAAGKPIADAWRESLNAATRERMGLSPA